MRDLASHEHEARVENMETEPINLDWKVKLVCAFQHIHGYDVGEGWGERRAKLGVFGTC